MSLRNRFVDYSNCVVATHCRNWVNVLPSLIPINSQLSSCECEPNESPSIVRKKCVMDGECCGVFSTLSCDIMVIVSTIWTRLSAFVVHHSVNYC